MERLIEDLPMMGHRNLIVAVDSGFSWMSAPGIATQITDLEMLAVVGRVLTAVKKAPHVRPEIILDSELPHVTESESRGVTAYRKGLEGMLDGLRIRSQPHEKNIAMLHEVAGRFHVQIIKTVMTIPYASVYVELHSGYWSPEAESRLRGGLPADFGGEIGCD
jgi:hypothetical protein